jgi:hypothetical protein
MVHSPDTCVVALGIFFSAECECVEPILDKINSLPSKEAGGGRREAGGRRREGGGGKGRRERRRRRSRRRRGRRGSRD